MNTETIRNILRKHSLKVTPIRVQVLNVLLDSRVALSHADITERLDGEHVDKVTLYRTLNHFCEKNIIHKVANEERNWLYAIHIDDETHPEPDHAHAHFICDDCERIYCFPLTREAGNSVQTVKQGFLVTNQEIRLHGLCPSCQ